jgi:hypothetical protein
MTAALNKASDCTNNIDISSSPSTKTTDPDVTPSFPLKDFNTRLHQLREDTSIPVLPYLVTTTWLFKQRTECERRGGSPNCGHVEHADWYTFDSELDPGDGWFLKPYWEWPHYRPEKHLPPYMRDAGMEKGESKISVRDSHGHGNGVRSGTGTPTSGNVARKKLTLGDYNSGLHKGLEVPNGVNGSRSGSDGEQKHRPSPSVKQVSNVPRGEKRPADISRDNERPKSRHESPPPAKKHRPSPIKHEAARKQETTTATPARPEIDPISPDLPPYLSPTLPPFIEAKLTKIEGMTPLANYKKHKKNDSSSSFSDAKHTFTSSPSLKNGKPRPVENHSRPSSSQHAGKSPRKGPITIPSTKDRAPDKVNVEARKKPLSSDAKKADVGGKSVKPNGITNKQLGGPGISPSLVASPRPDKVNVTKNGIVKDSKIVKLKFSKRKRKDLERILQMSQKPVRAPREAPRDDRREHGRSDKYRADSDIERDRRPDRSDKYRGDSDRERDRKKEGDRDKARRLHENNAPKTTPRDAREVGSAEKKRRPQEDERERDPPAKRPKPEPLREMKKSDTPLSAAFKSPIPKDLKGPPSKEATPAKKTMASHQMQRLDSQEGRARTPQSNTRGDSSAPPSVDRNERRGHTKSDSQTSINVKNVNGRPAIDPETQKQVDSWRGEHGKFAGLGRQQKKKYDEILKDRAADDWKRAFAYGLDSIL